MIRLSTGSWTIAWNRARYSSLATLQSLAKSASSLLLFDTAENGLLTGVWDPPDVSRPATGTELNPDLTIEYLCIHKSE
jgi:hypothetical protein